MRSPKSQLIFIKYRNKLVTNEWTKKVYKVKKQIFDQIMRWNILIWCYVGCRYCIISATYNLSFVQIRIRIQIKACVYNYEVIAKFMAYVSSIVRPQKQGTFLGTMSIKTENNFQTCLLPLLLTHEYRIF